MIPGFVGGIILLVVWIYLCNRRDKKEFEVAATVISQGTSDAKSTLHSQTRDVVMLTLEDLQCKAKFNAKHPEYIDYQYQGEYFRIVVRDDYAFITLYDYAWATIDLTNLDDVSNMRRIINDLNWVCTGNIGYTKNDRSNKLDILNTYSMLCMDNMDFKNYLQAMMNESFEIHREFSRRMNLARSK